MRSGWKVLSGLGFAGAIAIPWVLRWLEISKLEQQFQRESSRNEELVDQLTRAKEGMAFLKRSNQELLSEMDRLQIEYRTLKADTLRSKMRSSQHQRDIEGLRVQLAEQERLLMMAQNVSIERGNAATWTKMDTEKYDWDFENDPSVWAKDGNDDD